MSTEALTNVTPIRAVPLTEGEAAALIHDSYLVQVHSHLCTNCQAGERFISLFEVWTHPTKTHSSRYIVKKPTTKLVAGFEVTYMEIPVVEMPICSECVAEYEIKGGNNRLFAALSPSAWATTLARKYAPAPAAAAKGRPEPTLDSL